ncbi:MAG: hypothetical protein JW742_02695 [Candidatus Aminicenantes bacterium]|nr:hypothetical protein [Candidatus Aminicenantes bacterium]
MSRCRRRILWIFGGLFLAAALVVPYRTTRVCLDRDTATNIVWRRTFRRGGYMFLLRFLPLVGERRTDGSDPDVRYALLRAQNVTSVRYEIDTLRLAFELAAISLLGAYNFRVLCRTPRRRPGEGEEILKEGRDE